MFFAERHLLNGYKGGKDMDIENRKVTDDKLGQVSGGADQTQGEMTEYNGILISQDGNCPYCQKSNDEYIGRNSDYSLYQYHCYECQNAFWKKQ